MLCPLSLCGTGTCVGPNLLCDALGEGVHLLAVGDVNLVCGGACFAVLGLNLSSNCSLPQAMESSVRACVCVRVRARARVRACLCLCLFASACALKHDTAGVTRAPSTFFSALLVHVPDHDRASKAAWPSSQSTQNSKPKTTAIKAQVSKANKHADRQAG